MRGLTETNHRQGKGPTERDRQGDHGLLMHDNMETDLIADDDIYTVAMPSISIIVLWKI